MKKILLIGGEGFIGNRFIELYGDQFECTTWDLKSDNNINLNVPREKRDRIGNLPVIYDIVIFLAARPNLRSLLQNPKDAIRTATMGLQNALKYYQDTHFVYISSSMVYGNWTKTTMSEEDNPSPTNMYGTLKLLSEYILKQYHSNYTIIRPSAVYGYGDHKRRVTQLFLNKIYKDEPIVLQGADNLFDFTHVDDVAQGLQLVCNSDPKNQTYNITKGIARSLRYFTDLLYEKLNKKPNYTVEPIPKNYPIRGALDISKAQYELKYDPKFDLSQGLDDTISKYQQTK